MNKQIAATIAGVAATVLAGTALAQKTTSPSTQVVSQTVTFPADNPTYGNGVDPFYTNNTGRSVLITAASVRLVSGATDCGLATKLAFVSFTGSAPNGSGGTIARFAIFGTKASLAEAAAPASSTAPRVCHSAVYLPTPVALAPGDSLGLKVSYDRPFSALDQGAAVQFSLSGYTLP
jgi:hypothetical protein